MHRSRRRWLVVFSVLAALGLTLGFTVEGGSAASKKSPKHFCDPGNKQIKKTTTQTVPANVAAKAGPTAQAASNPHHNTIYIICERRTRAAGANGKAGPPGPAGPAGPPGPAGAAGANGVPTSVSIQRTAIPFASGFMADGGNIQNLATVGPIHVDGLCRHTFPGPGGVQNRNGNNTVTYPAPFLPTPAGESEAQVIVWSGAGSLSFKGAHGHRENVPPGPPDYTPNPNDAPGNGRAADTPITDPVAGEGDHLFLSASNETVDEARATDPAADNQADPNVKQLAEYPAFNYGGGVVGTSDGHALVAQMLAGFDVLGVYGECVFAGVLRPLS